jgi:hypothetical protein
LTRTEHILVSFLCGYGTAMAVTVLHQDSYGGLEGYCAYLHEPGRWVDAGFKPVLYVGIYVVAMAVVFRESWKEKKS